MRIKKTITIN